MALHSRSLCAHGTYLTTVGGPTAGAPGQPRSNRGTIGSGAFTGFSTALVTRLPHRAPRRGLDGGTRSLAHGMPRQLRREEGIERGRFRATARVQLRISQFVGHQGLWTVRAREGAAWAAFLPQQTNRHGRVHPGAQPLWEGALSGTAFSGLTPSLYSIRTASLTKASHIREGPRGSQRLSPRFRRSLLPDLRPLRAPRVGEAYSTPAPIDTLTSLGP